MRWKRPRRRRTRGLRPRAPPSCAVVVGVVAAPVWCGGGGALAPLGAAGGARRREQGGRLPAPSERWVGRECRAGLHGHRERVRHTEPLRWVPAAVDRARRGGADLPCWRTWRRPSRAAGRPVLDHGLGDGTGIRSRSRWNCTTRGRLAAGSLGRTGLSPFRLHAGAAGSERPPATDRRPGSTHVNERSWRLLARGRGGLGWRASGRIARPARLGAGLLRTRARRRLGMVFAALKGAMASVWSLDAGGLARAERWSGWRSRTRRVCRAATPPSPAGCPSSSPATGTRACLVPQGGRSRLRGGVKAALRCR